MTVSAKVQHRLRTKYQYPSESQKRSNSINMVGVGSSGEEKNVRFTPNSLRYTSDCFCHFTVYIFQTRKSGYTEPTLDDGFCQGTTPSSDKISKSVRDAKMTQNGSPVYFRQYMRCRKIQQGNQGTPNPQNVR